ncbi:MULTISPECIES: M56 family metallopeptidase [Kitasatospora]|uniref:M56 family metallopeptidase n=1 Tax=Kitasatospora TaxID=2063 RepID=UPI000CC5F69D|nr:M56 family metallopeptidase [Kitasatospora sp. GP30]MDH6139986.1 Zn-dependent protease with chaperone function [Kitasatospora sp. GP30]
MTALAAALVLALYAVLVGTVAPRRLARAHWPQRAPRLALAVWYGLAATFTVACSLAAYHLTLTGPHAHGLLALFDSDAPSAAEGPTVLLPVGLGALWPLGAIAAAARRARRERADHLDRLALAGRRDAALDAVLLDHPTPAAYCLARGPVVVSSGALAGLPSGQLNAVLEHERAHLTGRHHLLLTVSSGLSRALWRLPLAHGLRQQTATLLELMADDRAARRCSAEDLAAAVCEVATAVPSATALAAGGAGALLRIRRLLRPAPPLRLPVRLAVLAAIALGPTVPYLLTCGPIPR